MDPIKEYKAAHLNVVAPFFFFFLGFFVDDYDKVAYMVTRLIHEICNSSSRWGLQKKKPRLNNFATVYRKKNKRKRGKKIDPNCFYLRGLNQHASSWRIHKEDYHCKTRICTLKSFRSNEIMNASGCCVLITKRKKRHWTSMVDPAYGLTWWTGSNTMYQKLYY